MECLPAFLYFHAQPDLLLLLTPFSRLALFWESLWEPEPEQASRRCAPRLLRVPTHNGVCVLFLVQRTLHVFVFIGKSVWKESKIYLQSWVRFELRWLQIKAIMVVVRKGTKLEAKWRIRKLSFTLWATANEKRDLAEVARNPVSSDEACLKLFVSYFQHYLLPLNVRCQWFSYRQYPDCHTGNCNRAVESSWMQCLSCSCASLNRCRY